MAGSTAFVQQLPKASLMETFGETLRDRNMSASAFDILMHEEQHLDRPTLVKNPCYCSSVQMSNCLTMMRISAMMAGKDSMMKPIHD